MSETNESSPLPQPVGRQREREARRAQGEGCIELMYKNTLPQDRLTLHQLEVETTIGTYDFERQLKQKLKITVHFSLDAEAIAKTDDLDSGMAIDYDRLSQTIRDFGFISEFCLLETFSVKLIDHLFALYPLHWIQLEVTKMAALKKAQGVTLTLCRISPSPV